MRLSEVKKKEKFAPLLPETMDSIIRRLSNVEADQEGLRRRVKQMDYDLQDAVDGFYRRRQSDRMREIRDEDADKRIAKPRTWKDLMASALARDQPPRGSAEQPSGE